MDRLPPVMSSPRHDAWRRSRSVYDLPPPNQRPRAVYVHVPFCRHRCGYCDFTLVANRDDLTDQYLLALSNELEELEEVCAADTIFVGGGTPTHLSSSQLRRLLTLIESRFRLSSDGEYTFEANPDGLSDDKLKVLRDAGVNRISLGVQSFDAAVLRTLERSHSPREAEQTVTRAQRQIPNISLDLIFGVPGQSEDAWQRTLITAARLPIRHVSAYGLTFEKGTAFERRRARHELQPASDDSARRQYEIAMSLLPHAGFEQYEISNYARPSARCRHNEVYWDASEYFGFGPGAARYVNRTRSTNSRNVTGWINSWLRREPLLQEREQLSATDRAREAVMLGLRRNRGISEQAFEQRFGRSLRSLAPAALEKHLEQGLLEVTPASEDDDDSESWLRLTREGRFVADTVVVDFL